jgi:hypothetical protein
LNLLFEWDAQKLLICVQSRHFSTMLDRGLLSAIACLSLDGQQMENTACWLVSALAVSMPALFDI